MNQSNSTSSPLVESAPTKIMGHILIRDADTKEVFVDQREDFNQNKNRGVQSHANRN